ncbi:PIR protein [Plasmodium ovale]|uniref:PIR protein n=1 Tax=Plasmodium ovale TaxID=36330 RepID=A0A1C3KJM3_PLAOA|nr:PIR protein [Plasmodium ovale]
MLGLSAEQCKSYVDMASKYAALPQGIADFCECIGNTDSTSDEQPKSNSKCACIKDLKTNGLSESIEKFKGCNPTKDLSSNSFPNVLHLLTNSCYLNAIKEILQKLGSIDNCDIKLSQYTEKITKALDILQTTAKTTLKYSGAFNSIVVLSEKLLRNVMNDISKYNIILPLCISASVAIILIGIFYMIYKEGSCLCFGSRKKKGNQNYDEEMQNLYEQYNQTLQSAAMLNRYLLGYHQG